MKITKGQGSHWAAVTRRNYRNGTLSPELITACEGIPGWSWEQQQIGPTKRTFLPFAKARAFVRRLHLQGPDWRAYCKSRDKPTDIPANPWKVYKEWRGLNDWLGSRKRYEYRSFEQARAFVHALKLKTYGEWMAYAKSAERPPDVPTNPNVKYRGKGWVGNADWFGFQGNAKSLAAYARWQKRKAKAAGA
jgi:hypothetical protein